MSDLSLVHTDGVPPRNWREQVRLRIFQMPCCRHQLCWVNPRLPNFCPECGQPSLARLRVKKDHTLLEAVVWLQTVPRVAGEAYDD
jgi:hypothetical protein